MPTYQLSDTYFKEILSAVEVLPDEQEVIK